MNRNFGALLLFVIVLFAACSNSDNLAGVTTEPNDIAKETENALSASVGISSASETSGGTGEETALSCEKNVSRSSSSASRKRSSSSAFAVALSSATVILDVIPESQRAVLDSVLSSLEGNNGFAQSDDSTHLPTTSSSKTAYNFRTAGQSYFEQSQCFVRLYEDEYGVQMLGGLHGFFMQTTLVLQDKHVVLRMLNNNYWGGNLVTECRTDSTSFQKNCESNSGVFRNYRTGSGCESVGGSLQLACAMPMTETAAVSELLTDEAEMYKRNCKSEQIKEPVCTEVCETSDAGESCQMSCL
jgi:hypothetical protein